MVFFFFFILFLEMRKINERKTPISKLNILKNMVNNLLS